MILEKTMNEMPETFTSHEFNKRAVKNGYPIKALKRKGLSNFIRKHADNAYFGSKTWVKKKKKSVVMSDDEMIIHLKNKGYKIQKQKINWIDC